VLYPQTTIAPNGWASVSLWRRFFELQDDEKEEMMDAVARALEQDIDEREVRPIVCEDVKVARKEFIHEYYQRMTAPTINQNHQIQARLSEDQQLNRPNLQVPVTAGMPESAYLAQ
jgi:hypothetical protein